jgi:DNA invertase Pin-like site-specific DNA recombinase
MKKKRVALYVRVSTIDQHPENQSVELKDYVNRNPEYELAQIYEDKISGTKDTRPQLDKMMQDARNHYFDHVIFWKVDRLGRSALHTWQIVEEWKRHGITFSISTLGIDTSTSVGKFVFGIMSQYAELEREQIVERTNLSMKRIKKELKEKGFYITDEGKRITSLGRPKGHKDKKPRKRRGYFLRDAKKRSPRKNANVAMDDKITVKKGTILGESQ